MSDPPARPTLLILTSTFPAYPGDGTPEFVLTLARALAGRYEVLVLAPRIRGAEAVASMEGVEVKRFAYFFKRWEGLADGAILPNLRSQPWRVIEAPFLVLAFALSALRLARRRRPNVVNAHWIVPAGLVARVLRTLLGVPYVLTAHGADAYALGGPVWGRLKRKVIERAASVTAVSRDIGIRLDLADLDEHVVPMGVDVDEIRRLMGDRDPERGRFLFVGRLVDKKGADVLLKAVAQIRDARLVVVGDGPERHRLEAMKNELGLGERAEFRGRLQRPAVFEEMRLAHAVVIPSVVGAGGDQEGTPVVMAEAMAAGVPVIASDLGGLGEYIPAGRGGILVTPGSVGELAGALRTMLGRDGLPVERGEIPTLLDLRTTAARYVGFLDSASSAREV